MMTRKLTIHDDQGIQTVISWLLLHMWSRASDQWSTSQKIIEGTLVEDRTTQKEKHSQNCVSISFNGSFGDLPGVKHRSPLLYQVSTYQNSIAHSALYFDLRFPEIGYLVSRYLVSA